MSEDYAHKYETTSGRILLLLWDMKWHTNTELYGPIGGTCPLTRLGELESKGWKFEKRPSHIARNGNDYRLVSRERGEPKGKRVRVYLEEADAAKAAQGRLTDKACDDINDALRAFRAVNKKENN